MSILDDLGLNPFQRSAIPNIQNAILNGMSGNALQKSLMGTPAAMRRQKVQALVRFFRGNQIKQDYVKSVNYNKLMNPDRIPISQYSYRNPYMYTVSYKGINSLSGQYETGFINVSSNTQLTKEQAVNIADTEIIPLEKSPPVVDYELNFETAERSPLFFEE